MKVEKKRIGGTGYAVFHVPVTGKVVYMEQRLRRSHDDVYFVVWADRFRFESVWFKCSSWVAPELARGNETDWRRVHNFPKAEMGFAQGMDNPVPLAELTAFSYYPSLAFIDGIARTVWLMANGAAYFPVLAYDKETAENLHRYIGVKGSPVLSNNDLFAMLDECRLSS